MTSETLSNNLNLLMANTRMNANELARQTGIPASSIKKIRNNNHPNPTLSTLTPIAHFFSITVSQLIGDTSLSATPTAPNEPIKMLPIIAWDDAASWPTLTKPAAATIATERHYTQQAFGLSIRENINEIFSKGTVLIIEPDMKPQQHNYVIIQKDLQNSPSIKQVVIEDGKIFLKSILIDQPPILKTHEHRILGIVMEYRRILIYSE
jgi:transcriptional regulator with XRE-family HTH domain